MLILYFHIFQKGLEVLKEIFQVFVYVIIVIAKAYYNMYQYLLLENYFNILKVVELLLYSKKYFLI